MISMTGFASLTTFIEDNSGKKIPLSLSLKSVNNRFFEINCRVPSALQSVEIDMINLLRQILLRGKCFLSISYTDPTTGKENVQPSLPAISSYLKAITLIQETYNLPGTISITDLLSVPDLFVSAEVQSDETTRLSLLNAVKEVAHLLMEARRLEGTALAADTAERIVLIESTFATLEQKVKFNFTQRTEKIKGELKALEEIKDSEMLRHQISNELNRSDITEELVRFTTHLSSFSSILKENKVEKGRQLDFILQELGREINTISAKSSDAAIGHTVITIKVELEKIKEQIQNIV